MTNVLKPSNGERSIQGEEMSQMAPSRYDTLGCYISGASLSESSKVVASASRSSSIRRARNMRCCHLDPLFVHLLSLKRKITSLEQETHVVYGTVL